MQALRDWSFARVLLVSSSWIFVCVLAAVAYVLFQLRGLFDASSGSAGIGAVSFGFNLLTLAIPLLPPVLVIGAWVVRRRSNAA